MRRFTHDTLGQRVILASGGAATHLTAEIARLGGERVMVVADGPGADLAAQALGEQVALRWTEVLQHVPVELAERGPSPSPAA
ncbi:hypothetical protein [Ornithinimicrobium cerasi]|uniref:hypothetical protein n=1 Tax=Ornithinimicrobium cerasi TaxID=2248773 RepID=UPI00301CF8C8